MSPFDILGGSFGVLGAGAAMMQSVMGFLGSIADFGSSFSGS